MPEGAPKSPKTPEDLQWARHGFINDIYPKLFGREYTSDSTVEITSLNVTSLLLQYEALLIDQGLIAFGKGEDNAAS